MLGFNAEFAVATNKSEYGNVEPNFIMDEVKCNGNEETLEDCEHNLTHDCKRKEAAGVICSETRITTQRNEEDLTTPRSSSGFGQFVGETTASGTQGSGNALTNLQRGTVEN